MDSYKTKYGILYKGDALEKLCDIPDDSIQLHFSDLPYETTGNNWDVLIDPDRLWSEFYRTMNDTGVIVLTTTITFALTMLNAKPSKFLYYDLIWQKSKAVGFMQAKWRPLRSHENILVFYLNVNHKYNPQFIYGAKPYKTLSTTKTKNYGLEKRPQTRLIQSDGKRHPKSILDFKFKTGEAGLHMTQKPESLCEWVIQSYSDQGDTVCDVSCGSATTPVVAERLKRNWIGIEKSQEFFDVGMNRLKFVPNGFDSLLGVV